jgi:hypothetical protein
MQTTDDMKMTDKEAQMAYNNAEDRQGPRQGQQRREQQCYTDNNASDIDTDDYATMQMKTQTMYSNADNGIQHRRPRTMHRMDNNADKDNSAVDNNA